MVKKRGPGRPRKRGRPKGSKNKTMEKFITERQIENKIKMGLSSNIASRIDIAVTDLETTIKNTIIKLKEMI